MLDGVERELIAEELIAADTFELVNVEDMLTSVIDDVFDEENALVT